MRIELSRTWGKAAFLVLCLLLGGASARGAGVVGNGLLQILAAIVIAGAGCLGRARKSEPLAGPTVLDRAAEERGQLVFMEYCNQCHPGGAAGLAPGLNDLKIPGPLIKTKVRTGYPIMPPFPKNMIAPDELDDLVQYLLAMRAKEDGR